MSDRETLRDRLDRIWSLVGSLRIAIEMAYSGSAEHGSFLRGGSGECVPSPHWKLHELESELADMKRDLALLVDGQ